MNKSLIKIMSGAALLGLAIFQVHAQSFSGAQGYGAVATGGSTVYTVNNLNDSGTGSLRDALSASGRYVKFSVTGTITLKSELAVPSNTTLDGTTAPSPGITIVGQPVSTSDHNNIIIRNLRFRETDSGPSGKGSLMGSDCYDIMIDHCSIEQGRWDCQEFTGSSHDITVQWSIIGEGIDPQNFGELLDGEDRVSIHHNLFVDNESRNPKLKANSQYIDNVIYNWGGGGGLVGGHSSAPWNSDIINNFVMAGPSSTANWLTLCNSNDVWYVSGNEYDLNADGVWTSTAIPNSQFTAQGVTIRSTVYHHPTYAVTIDSPAHCVDLATGGYLGCQPQDATDKRLCGYVKSYGTQGQIGLP
jgi:pectate lyase